MEIENFIIRDVSYKAREERLELASTGSSCSLPKGQCHVACLPSLFSALRVNFPPHKKKNMTTPQDFQDPKASFPQRHSSEQQMEPDLTNKLKGYRLANHQTADILKPKDLEINIRLGAGL